MLSSGEIKKRLPLEEIKKRLRIFNETYDWSVFADVPAIQHIDVIYPHLITPGKTKEERTKILDEIFGPLP